MDNKGEYKEDILRHFINREMIEKAPEGFTSKVMSQIQVETVSAGTVSGVHKRSLIPVISGIVALILILAAVLFPGTNSDSLTFPGIEFLKNIKLSLPEIDFGSLFRLSLPVALLYACIGILILSLFDRALYGVFHRRK